MGKLTSWTCNGCTNVCWRLVDGEVFKYCRLFGRMRTEWQGDYLACLDYTTDPNATDRTVRLWTRREVHDEAY